MKSDEQGNKAQSLSAETQKVHSCNCPPDRMLLYAVTDRAWLNGRSLYSDVQEALKGGATMIQLREKDLDYGQFLTEAIELKELCAQYNVPLIINDNIDIALACNADGVHLGQSDLAASEARLRLGENKIIGISAQTVEQAISAQQDGADYLGVGAVFTTSTKKDADFVSYDVLKDICASVAIPVCAIGGIYKHNIMQLAGSGIDGVALVSAIFAAKDIEKECNELLSLSKRMVRA